MRGDDVRRERAYERLAPAELQAVYDSRDWRERMIRHGENGGPEVHARLCALARTRRAVLARDRCPVADADVAYVYDVNERQWVDDFNAFVADPVRAASAQPFDDSLLFDLPAPGCQGRSCVTRPHIHIEDRRLERVARSTKGAWIPAHDAIHVTRLLAVQREQWPVVPNLWMTKEVPYRLRVGTPLVVRTHGLLMVRYGFGAPTISGDADSARARAAWCAALTQSVQLVASELVDECARFGRLFWVPPALVAIMRDIGGERLLGAVTGRGRLLEHILDGVGSVRWDLIDPCGTVCAKSTTFGTPVFVAGDAAAWDASVHPNGALAVDPRLRRPRHETPRRSQRLWGFMSPCGRREPCHGWGLRTAHWRGVPVDEMRIGGPCGWEREAASSWREHCRRLRGSSASGVQRELLRLGNLKLDQGVDAHGIPRVPESTPALELGPLRRHDRDPQLVHRSNRVRQDNTPAWVRERAERGKPVRIVTDMPPPTASPPLRIRNKERQGAGSTVPAATHPPGYLSDRYSILPWERRQDLAVQIMSSLIEISSDTGRQGEIIAEDVRQLLTESAHPIIRELVPPRGQVMARPNDGQVSRVNELMNHVLGKDPGRHSAGICRDGMEADNAASVHAPSATRVLPTLGINTTKRVTPAGSSASHAKRIASDEATVSSQALDAAASSIAGTIPTEFNSHSSTVTGKRSASMLDLCQYPRSTSPKRRCLNTDARTTVQK